MWQEARKQEKKLRGMMVDHKKRAERRKEYYERIVSTSISGSDIHYNIDWVVMIYFRSQEKSTT